jgi:hypothetical protein
MAEERDPQQAIDDIREELGEDDEPSAEEREFLESEGVRLDEDDEGNEPVV